LIEKKKKNPQLELLLQKRGEKMELENGGLLGILIGILIGLNLPRIQKAVASLVEPEK
jgi:tetrahydromethanopterin S-methyltransferase subunit G